MDGFWNDINKGLMSFVGNSPQSIGKEQKFMSAERATQIMTKNKLVERARNCNRRKDLLHLLLSYCMKPEADQADLFLLRDNFIKLNQTIKRFDTVAMKKNKATIGVTVLQEYETHDSILVELIMKDIPATLEDVECRLAKYDFDIDLYFTGPIIPDISVLQAERFRFIAEGNWNNRDSAIFQILHFIKEGQLKVIGISGNDAEFVTKGLEDLPELRSMFELVISFCVSQFQSISEVQTGIAEQIHRLVGTDVSLPLYEALKPYKFLLFLHCSDKKTDLHELKIPEHGLVVLTTQTMNIYQIMPVDLEIRMEDLLLPWTLFWKNVRYIGIPSPIIEQTALQLIEACNGHLLAIVLLARALNDDVVVWKLALQELTSLSKLSSPVEGMSEVMVRVLKFIWERKSSLARHCLKHFCNSVTKGEEHGRSSLILCWQENDLIETYKEGEDVLKDLMDSFLLEDAIKPIRFLSAMVKHNYSGKNYLRMREETRDILLKQFIPHLHPLNLQQEGLGLSEPPDVTQWDAKEINLNNNELSELPEKPNCHFLVKLFLQKNYNLMEIPQFFFECMPRLQVLDLSYTSIKSLPPSISSLSSLQALLLKGCELFMELPPEIGALSNLQVFDLEGTEIMNLPCKIGELTNLECLTVSFYGYGNSYRESNKINKRIPMGLLSRLRSLKQLSIVVNLDDEEWVSDVEDFILELQELRELRTLKLYLPKIELLNYIDYQINFQLTVGHHKKRIISCLPHAVEEEFEKQEKYLKYINGEDIPTEIKNALRCTIAFFLERHWTVKKLSEFGNENMVELKFCLLVECNELQTIIDGVEFFAEDYKCDSGVDKTLVLGLLEYLGIHCMMNLRSISEGTIGKGCLSKLKSLTLRTCPNLTTVFTTSLLGNLDNLEKLVVEDCPKITSLISRESSYFESNQFLPSLKEISLLDLPELVSISSGLCIARKLEMVIIYACPMLENLSPMELSSLKVIKGEIEWWDSLEWGSRQDYMTNIFVELKRDASLMAQLKPAPKTTVKEEMVIPAPKTTVKEEMVIPTPKTTVKEETVKEEMVIPTPKTTVKEEMVIPTPKVSKVTVKEQMANKGNKNQSTSVIPAPKTTVKEKMVQSVASAIKKNKNKKKIKNSG